MTVSHWEPFVEVPREGLGSLAQFVHDTPWTTTAFQAVRSRKGSAHVDVPAQPRNFVVRVAGAETRPGVEAPDRAYVFGLPNSDGLRAHVAGVSRPTEFVVDEDLAPMLLEIHPGAEMREALCCWFDRLTAPAVPPTNIAVRRLRPTEVEAVERLVPASAYRAFESTKEMILAGGCFGVDVGGSIVSVAFVADQSVKYARIDVFTAAPMRRKGLAMAAARRLIEHCANDGRLVCVVVPRRDPAAVHFALRIGFPQKALLNTYVVRPGADSPPTRSTSSDAQTQA